MTPLCHVCHSSNQFIPHPPMLRPNAPMASSPLEIPPYQPRLAPVPMHPGTPPRKGGARGGQCAGVHGACVLSCSHLALVRRPLLCRKVNGMVGVKLPSAARWRSGWVLQLLGLATLRRAEHGLGIATDAPARRLNPRIRRWRCGLRQRRNGLRSLHRKLVEAELQKGT